MVSQSISIVVYHRPKLLLVRASFYTGYMRTENKFLFFGFVYQPCFLQSFWSRVARVCSGLCSRCGALEETCPTHARSMEPPGCGVSQRRGREGHLMAQHLTFWRKGKQRPGSNSCGSRRQGNKTLLGVAECDSCQACSNSGSSLLQKGPLGT